MSAATDRVIEAARAFGLRIEVKEFPEGTRTAEDAARAIGCDVAAIVKSLVFHADGEEIVVFVGGRHRVDMQKLIAVSGAASVRKATAEEARASTGFAIGGTPPFGHARQLRMYLDEALLSQQEVWCAGGTPTTVFAIEPAALLKATQAQVDDLHEDPGRRV